VFTLDNGVVYFHLFQAVATLGSERMRMNEGTNSSNVYFQKKGHEYVHSFAFALTSLSERYIEADPCSNVDGNTR
jgi:hypothetical protein